MKHDPMLFLGTFSSSERPEAALEIPARHLVTHGVVVGMTGSGKTGLVTVFAEEALRAKVPTILIDVKGDLGNLLLTPSEASEELRAWGFDDEALRGFVETTALRFLTPGSSVGESLHVFSALERRSERWKTDPDGARDALTASISLLLRLLGREHDPAKSREHVFLSVLAERRLLRGDDAPLAALVNDVLEPPIERIGALTVNAFLKKSERLALAAALNTLLASPSFANWRTGVSLDVAEWVRPSEDGRTPGVILSVAHLDDAERMLVLGLVLEEILSWVRGLSGSSRLEALVVFDEIYGFLPPYPANPPTKRPLVALMKQARAFGVGVLVATQNPMDLDYRALSNAGLWCVGRLQTDADRARVVEGLADAGIGSSSAALNQTIAHLEPRWFVMRDAHVPSLGNVLVYPRHALSLLRGPMSRSEIQKALAKREGLVLEPSRVGRPPSEPRSVERFEGVAL